LAENLLEVKDLRVEFALQDGVTHILNDLSLSFKDNSFLGLVGESGSGKTVLAYALLGYAKIPGRIAGGQVIYNGQDILKLSEDDLIANYRGKEVGLIASNARAHLNPLTTIGNQLSTIYSAHSGANKAIGKQKALEMLELVKINDPKRRLNQYPHEFSGGMAQRIMIAMALINNPKIIIADDCTNGLDVTVASQIMDLFLNIIEEQNASSIFITHDLGIVAQCCTDVAIIYGGQIIETTDTLTFFNSCRHPYSQTLLDSLPDQAKKSDLRKMPYQRLNYYQLPKGCLFYDRCPIRKNDCAENEPCLSKIGDNHYVKCHYPLERA